MANPDMNRKRNAATMVDQFVALLLKKHNGDKDLMVGEFQHALMLGPAGAFQYFLDAAKVHDPRLYEEVMELQNSTE